MPSNLKLDDELVAKALEAGPHNTKQAAVNAALADLICAAAIRHGLRIFSLDKDFVLYSRHLPIKLMKS
jgi:Arc/MetJ family transcription regulator